MLHFFNFCNVIITFYDLLQGTAYAAISFRAILDQVIEAVDVTYMGGELFFTRDLKFQAKLTFYGPNQLKYYIVRYL
jgi:hypothetical protein